ncbi:unnamed protein product [Urochloa humidicola]
MDVHGVPVATDGEIASLALDVHHGVLLAPDGEAALLALDVHGAPLAPDIQSALGCDGHTAQLDPNGQAAPLAPDGHGVPLDLDGHVVSLAPDGHAATLSPDDQAVPAARGLSNAIAVARSLLPSAPPPAVEYNIPVVDVQRSQVTHVENMETIDWDSLQIVETHDEEGRIALMSENQLCELLGFREEETTLVPAEEINCRMDEHCVDGANIPISDALPSEMVISYDKDNPSMDLGTVYPSMEEFKMAVRQFAINKEFELGTEKSDKKRYRCYCKSSKDCPWRINGTKHKGQSTVEVTVLVDEHTCVSSMRMETKNPSQKWVASKAVPIIRDFPKIGAKELQDKLQNDHKVTIKYDTVWRGKEKALAEVYGKWEESFEDLFRWKAEVMKRCPGSVVEIDILEVDGQVYFHRFFCALKPCIDGFLEGCRPYLSIDTKTLNGRWNGQLAAAIAVDGHNWIYPLAYGFIPSEKEDHWTWFMEQLNKATGNPPLLAVCSDACKGLENSVRKVFPNAEQRECFFHLMKNFKKKFRGFGQISPAARAYREDLFYEYIASIISDNAEAVKWLQKNHKLLWYRCGFNPEIKCDYITSNIAESFNNMIRDHKELPVADLADKIKEVIMKLWYRRRNIADRLPEGRILPSIMVQLKANTRGLGHLKIVPATNWSAEVWDHSRSRVERHVVKLNQRTCTCLEWQHTGKSCQHVLAFVTRHRGVDLEQFVHDYYSVNRFRAAYAREIEPMTDKTQWPQVELPFVVGAPLAKGGVGRRRKLRIKGCLEGGHKKKGVKSTEGENAREGVIGGENGTVSINAKGKKMIRGPMTCIRCGELGHRQASSKCPLNGTAKKRKRRQPRKNVTKAARGELNTPERPTREEILRDSPGRVTRSRLAFLLGEGTSSQTNTTSPVRTPTTVAPKKMTPKRRLNIG